MRTPAARLSKATQDIRLLEFVFMIDYDSHEAGATASDNNGCHHTRSTDDKHSQRSYRGLFLRLVPSSASHAIREPECALESRTEKAEKVDKGGQQTENWGRSRLGFRGRTLVMMYMMAHALTFRVATVAGLIDESTSHLRRPSRT